MGKAYYNEWDPFACAWQRELIKDGLIAPGFVDQTDVLDVVPELIRDFNQWHLFSGIGVWSAALRAAGWADDREVLTVSCPCQPFSSAGKRAGFDDKRHLWPAAFHVISQLRPAVVFGEQVAKKDGLAWLDLVQADLEAAGYTVWAAVTAACGFGAPHIRQRLYFCAVRNGVGLADSDHARPQGWRGVSERAGELAAGTAGMAGRLADNHPAGLSALSLDRGNDAEHHAEPRGEPVGLDNAGRTGDERRGRAGDVGCAPSEEQGEAWQRERRGDADCDSSADGRLGDSSSAASEWHTGSLHTPEEGKHGAGVTVDGVVPFGLEHAGPGVFERLAQPLYSERRQISQPGQDGRDGQDSGRTEAHGIAGTCGEVCGRPGPVNGLWRVADWLYCRDAKWRAVESGTFPLADAGQFRNRVAELRGAGNALCIAQAEEFIKAVMEVLTEGPLDLGSGR